MDTEKCKVLLDVLKDGNIRHCAARLDYTPSGVSRMISSLEDEVGFSLLIRSKQGVAPTQACKDILPYIQQIVASARALNEAAANIRGLSCGSVRIGIAYPEYYDKLMRAIMQFHEYSPGVQFSVYEGLSTELADALLAGEFDVVFITKREGDFEWHTLARNKQMAIVSEKHELARAKKYPIKRLEQDPYIAISPGKHSDNDTMFKQFGVFPNIVAGVDNDEARYEMVAANLGVALTNSVNIKTLRKDVIALPLDPSVEFEIGIAISKTPTPAAQAFISYALANLDVRYNN